MVSIIIPTYGTPVFLRKSIESVISQTYNDWEIIIVDDNNPNTQARKETETLVSTYLLDSRITYIQHEHNKNGAVARNTGLAVIKGDYVAFLDSDDEYLSTRLEKCINSLEAHPQYGAVYTGCEFRKGGKKFSEFISPTSGNHLVETLASKFKLGTGSNLFLRRSVVNDLKAFDEAFLRHQDYEFMVRFFLKYDIDAIPEILVIKNNENFNRPDPDKMKQIKDQYLEKYKTEIIKLPKKQQDFIYYKQWVALAEQYLSVGKLKQGNEYYSLASKYSMLKFRDLIRRIAFTIIALIK